VIVLVLFFAILSVYLAWRFRAKARDPVAQVYDQLCRKLARANLPKELHEGPQAYLERVANDRPNLARELDEARRIYLDLRYGPAPMLTNLSRLKHLINQIHV
jgi:hypothetical protein